MTTIPPTPTIPSSYVLEVQSVICTHCGRTSRISNFFAVSYIGSRNSNDKARVTNKKPCDRAAYNLPYSTMTLPHRTTAYCYDCTDIDLTHLPTPPAAENVRPVDLVNRSVPHRPVKSTPVKPPRPRLADIA